MGLSRRAVDYLYSAFFLSFAATSLNAVRVIVAGNISADVDVPTRDVGIAWLKIFALPLPLWLSHTFYKHNIMAYNITLALAPFCFMILLAFFLVAIGDNNRSELNKMQLLGLATLVSGVITVDSLKQIIKAERAKKAASAVPTDSTPVEVSDSKED